MNEIREIFLEAYDDNKDGKIDIRELAQLLPMEENFLLLFRFDNPLDSSVEFMKLWRRYDADNSGILEKDEARKLVTDIAQASIKWSKDNMRKVLSEATGDTQTDTDTLTEMYRDKINNAYAMMEDPKTIDAVVSAFDTDGDGKISKQEFLDKATSGYDILEPPKKKAKAGEGEAGAASSATAEGAKAEGS